MDKFPTLESTFKRLREKNKAPGSVYLLAEGEKIIAEQSLGYRDLAGEEKVTSETVFGLASVTKSFTCAAIMHLQEKGKLKVSDKVKKYLPEFKMAGDPRVDDITIHHFMTHSSGIPPMFALEFASKRIDYLYPHDKDFTEINEDQSILHTYESLMEYMDEQALKLYADPGKQFSYSNEAYSLLGAIIERVSGQSYESYIYENIVDPIGMKHTRFTMTELADYPNKSNSFGKEENGDENEIIQDEAWSTTTSMQATGYLKSTAQDMIKYAQLFLNEGKVDGRQVLSQESIRQMISPQMRVQYKQYYGYGFRITEDYFGNTFIGHGGSLRSVSSRFGFIPEKNLSGIVLANIIGYPASTALDTGFKEYLGVDENESLYPETDLKLDKDLLLSYAGNYQSDEGANLDLKFKDDQLILEGKLGEFKTRFISPTEFIYYNDRYDDLAEILLDDDKKPYALLYGSRVVQKAT